MLKNILYSSIIAISIYYGSGLGYPSSVYFTDDSNLSYEERAYSRLSQMGLSPSRL